MNLASTVATSRMVAQQRAMDVTAHNLANLNTPGFRTQRMQFADWLARQSGDMAVNGGRVVAFTQDRASWREQRAGAVAQTGNPLDLAITGDGYFTVQTANGTRLTRAGRFSLMPDGAVADDSGNKLLDASNQPVTLPPTTTRITITGDGAIGTDTGPAGRIAVVKPTDPMAIRAEGDQLFVPTGPTEAVAKPSIVQGSLEGSNVQPIVETTRMMAALREFQFVSQFVQAEADRQKEAVDRILRPRA